jgi:L-ascorbate metabolism protein UlaG (beta-lactamase superfamily)
MPQGSNLIDEIKAHNGSAAVWWIGHNSWLIKSNDLLIATDLLLQDSYKLEPSPVTAEELAPVLDISFVTHGHDDHFNKYTSKILIDKSECLFVIPESCVTIAKDLGMPEHRMIIAIPREPFEVSGIEVKPLRAIHGNENFAIYYDANMQDCGYYMNIDGVSFLQPGDTYLLEDHLFLEHVDVLFFSPTEHNMYIDRSVFLINALEPDYIFPQHHGTIKYGEKDRFWAKGYPDEVRIRLTKTLQERYHIFSIGEMREIVGD